MYQQLPWLSDRTLGRVIPRLWRDWCPPGYDSAGDVARLWDALPDLAHRTAAVSYYRHQFRPGKPGAVYRSLHEGWDTALPRIPMLLLHGKYDGAIDVHLATISAEALPAGSRHEVIAAAGHFMQLDQPTTVARLISDYCEPQ